jgi:hypothetical protein
MRISFEPGSDESRLGRFEAVEVLHERNPSVRDGEYGNEGRLALHLTPQKDVSWRCPDLLEAEPGPLEFVPGQTAFRLIRRITAEVAA